MKRFLSKIITRKTGFVLILALQLYLLLFAYLQLSYFLPYIFGGFTIVSTIVVIYEINRDVHVDFKISWLVLIVAFPIVGTILYVFFHINPITGKIKRRNSDILRETSRMLHCNNNDTELSGLPHYVNLTSSFPTYTNPLISYYKSGMAMYEELLTELSAAEEYIFIESFILQQGYMWDGIYQILKQKVKCGVEVRVMYDGVGCVLTLPHNFSKSLTNDGIKSKIFSPVRPLLSTHQNNRDHRKIIVIDGDTVFTGGMNIADEYIGKKQRFGMWKDAGIKLKGEACKSYAVMFLQMWNITETTKEDYSRYLPETKYNYFGSGYVLPFADTPLDNEYVGMKTYLDIINSSKSYVYFMTPYLILPSDVSEALQYAAKRGVDVRIIVPKIPDKRYAQIISHTYYPGLIRSDVKIYEFTPGFIHSKVCISDGCKAVVGTINLDFRSLFLHYECAAYIYNNEVISDIKDDFNETLIKCRQFTQKDYDKLPLPERGAGRVLRLIAPLM